MKPPKENPPLEQPRTKVPHSNPYLDKLLAEERIWVTVLIWTMAVGGFGVTTFLGTFGLDKFELIPFTITACCAAAIGIAVGFFKVGHRRYQIYLSQRAQPPLYLRLIYDYLIFKMILVIPLLFFLILWLAVSTAVKH